MPSRNQQPVQPTPFEAPPAPATPGANTASTPSERRHSPWLAVALATLVLLALAVFTWLPAKVNGPGTAAPAPATAGGDSGAGTGARAPAVKTTPGPAATLTGAESGAAPQESAPWEESLRAKMRLQAQSVLEPLLDLQFTLEEQAVTQWAPAEFSAALALASAGDELYRKRAFDAATVKYREALAALQALQASVPQRLQAQLTTASEALEALDEVGALNALDIADLLAPDNPDASALRERAALQGRLRDAFGAAASAETAGQLRAARDELAAARDIDPQLQRARSEWQRVDAALIAEQYQDAMSRGYVALADNRLAEARAAFRVATTLRPQSREAQDALAQAGTANTDARLADLQREGLHLERAEQWQQAVERYEQAQQLDSTVLFAREGLARSRPRAAMDKQLREVLAAPERLSNASVAAQTARILEQAKAVQPRGPLLAGQITAMEGALELANTPVPVTLFSDAQTEVTVYKVARLGRFQQHQLQLRPGTYTAVGNRVGFRDVRESFTIEPGTSSLTVTIACTETI